MTVFLILFVLSGSCVYVASPWERLWSAHMHNGTWMDRECEMLARPYHIERAKWSVYTAQRLKQQAVLNARPAAEFRMDDIFSRFIESDGSVQYIEPLVGILRDPLTICENLQVDAGIFEATENWWQAKRHLLPAFRPARRHILVDAGASLYAGWGGDATATGAKWFVELYARHGIEFDTIISFEATPYTPQQIFDSVPARLLGRYMYFNVPVSASPGSAYNPWNVLMTAAAPDDFVVVKLDIDQPAIERALAQQLISNTTIRQLVDEFFFEHHVESNAMNAYWNMRGDSQRMASSYSLFENLRAAGVRAHSWP